MNTSLVLVGLIIIALGFIINFYNQKVAKSIFAFGFGWMVGWLIHLFTL